MKSACAAEFATGAPVRRDNARPLHESHMPDRRRWPHAKNLDAPVGSFREFLIEDAVALKARSIGVHDATSRRRPAALFDMRSQSVVNDGFKRPALTLRNLPKLGKQTAFDLERKFLKNTSHISEP
jgi:hypothetical protein